MFKVIIPIILIATTIITYISFDYLSNKQKDNNNRAEDSDEDSTNQLSEESSIAEINEEKVSNHFVQHIEESKNFQEQIVDNIDTKHTVQNELNISSKLEDVHVCDDASSHEPPLAQGNSLPSEEIKVEDQFTITQSKEDEMEYTYNDTFSDRSIINGIKEDTIIKEPENEKQDNEDAEYQTGYNSVEQQVAAFATSQENQLGGVVVDHLGDASAEEDVPNGESSINEQEKEKIKVDQYESAPVAFEEKEQIGGPMLEKQVNKQVEVETTTKKESISIEFKSTNQNEIERSIVTESIESPIIFKNGSKNHSNITTTTTTTTTSTTNNHQIQPKKKEHYKCDISFAHKNLIKYTFMFQNSGRQYKQQSRYQNHYLKYTPIDAQRHEILVTGYSNASKIQVISFFGGCDYEEFIYGPEVSYIRLSSEKYFKNAISLDGFEISDGIPLTIINYKGGLGIEHSNILCHHHHINNNCIFDTNCRNIHEEHLPEQDEVPEPIYQLCLHPNHIIWWSTMPLLKLTHFLGKEYQYCNRCRGEDNKSQPKYKNNKFNKHNNSGYY